MLAIDISPYDKEEIKHIYDHLFLLSSNERLDTIILANEEQYEILKITPQSASGAYFAINSMAIYGTKNEKKKLEYMGRPVYRNIEDIYRCIDCRHHGNSAGDTMLICQKHYKTILALDELRKK